MPRALLIGADPGLRDALQTNETLCKYEVQSVPGLMNALGTLRARLIDVVITDPVSAS